MTGTRKTAGRGAAMFAAGAMVWSATSAAGQTDNIWIGANTGATGTNPSAEVNLDSNWSLGHVPTVGERAVFAFEAENDDDVDLFIDAGDAAFNPGDILFDFGDGAPYVREHVYLDKSLTTGGLEFRASGTSGSLADARFHLGALTTEPVILNLTGNRPLDLTQGTLTNWGNLDVSNSDPNAVDLSGSVVLNLSGSDIVFETMNQSGTNAVNNEGINGGGARMNFTAVGGTVTIQSAGVRGEGTIGLRNVQLAVRSDQTWNVDDTGYVRMQFRSADPDAAVVESIDGGRLDNLGELNLVVQDRSGGHGTMNLLGGTYGSLNFRADGNTSARQNDLRMLGDVALVGNAVVPGDIGADIPAEQTPYSLILKPGDGGDRARQRVILNGHTLALGHGLLIDNRGTRSSGDHQGLINATGSILTIGGDLVIDSSTQGADDILADGSGGNRNLGLYGDATTVVNLAGSFTANTVSTTAGEGLSAATLNLTGGGALQTYEIGDDAEQMAVEGDSFALGTLNVGAGGMSASARLVNEFLNDEALDVLTDSDGREMEKLIVGNLNIGAASALDVNGLSVLIADALGIDATGLLDLNTGETLTTGARVENFIGLGDQSGQWNGLVPFVTDSSNVGTVFTAVYDSALDQTFWQASSVIPEPATGGLALLGLGGLTMLGRRR